MALQIPGTGQPIMKISEHKHAYVPARGKILNPAKFRQLLFRPRQQERGQALYRAFSPAQQTFRGQEKVTRSRETLGMGAALSPGVTEMPAEATRLLPRE